MLTYAMLCVYVWWTVQRLSQKKLPIQNQALFPHSTHMKCMTCVHLVNNVIFNLIFPNSNVFYFSIYYCTAIFSILTDSDIGHCRPGRQMLFIPPPLEGGVGSECSLKRYMRMRERREAGEYGSVEVFLLSWALWKPSAGNNVCAGSLKKNKKQTLIKTVDVESPAINYWLCSHQVRREVKCTGSHFSSKRAFCRLLWGLLSCVLILY